MRTPDVRLVILILLSGLLVLTSCSEENLKPGVPAFVQIEPFEFTTNYPTQGTSRQQIKDVWVFADGATIGVFELPATIPVLKNGIGELRLEAGIELNGISTTRVNNPMFEPFIIDEFSFIPDSVVSVIPQSSYWETVEFVWFEDFEDPSVSLDTTNLGGNTALTRVSGENVFEGSYSGFIQLTPENDIFEAATFDSYVLPTSGQPVLLELHYKNDYYFSVGIIEQSSTQIIKTEIIVLYARNDWNKIYINITDKLRGSSASSFKILVRSYLETGNEEGNILIDNMKLLYR